MEAGGGSPIQRPINRLPKIRAPSRSRRMPVNSRKAHPQMPRGKEIIRRTIRSNKAIILRKDIRNKAITRRQVTRSKATIPRRATRKGNYPPQGNYPQNQNNQPAPPPVPAHLTIKAGTYVTARINQTLSSDRNQPGDAFTATLVQPVVIDGVVVAQRGQLISGRVAEAQKAGRVEGVSKLGVQLTELTLVDGQQMPIQSQMLNRTGPTSVGRDVGAIAGTTALGAAVGAAADWGRGAAIGAGAGLIASTVGVLLTRGHPTVIYPETVLTFRVEAPVEISTDHAPDAFRYVNPNDYERPPSYQGMGRPGLGPYGYAGPGYAGAPGYAPYYYGYAASLPVLGTWIGFLLWTGLLLWPGILWQGLWWRLLPRRAPLVRTESIKEAEICVS